MLCEFQPHKLCVIELHQMSEFRDADVYADIIPINFLDAYTTVDVYFITNMDVDLENTADIPHMWMQIFDTSLVCISSINIAYIFLFILHILALWLGLQEYYHRIHSGS